MPAKGKLVALTNIQVTKSKYRVSKQSVFLENTFLRPLVKGVDIERYHLKESGILVPFPYDELHTRIPLSQKELDEKSPKLVEYLSTYEQLLNSQTNYNNKIIGSKEKEFYALARVGDYSFGEYFVAFRDNTKWQACVVHKIKTSWGKQRPCFQNHAVSISQDSNGHYIEKDEAHYICAILNAPIVAEYLQNSSDSRSFKVRPPVHIPKYNAHNPVHHRLSILSQIAHIYYNDKKRIDRIDCLVDLLYIELCKRKPSIHYTLPLQ